VFAVRASKALLAREATVQISVRIMEGVSACARLRRSLVCIALFLFSESCVTVVFQTAALQVTYTLWDADKIQGCICDDGYSGVSCADRECVRGDDPLTTSQVDEVQLVSCRCGPDCTGTFKLSVKGKTTTAIAHDASAATVRAALEALSTVRAVDVILHNDNDASPICSVTGSSTSIIFTHDHGNLDNIMTTSSTLVDTTTPVLTLQTSGVQGTYVGASTAAYTSSQDGTRENAICNNRGLCDYRTGMCACSLGFYSSDGNGAFGFLGDCGFMFNSISITQTGTYPVVRDCPLASYGEVCGGFGSCSGPPNYVCTCDENHEGHDCSRIKCKKGPAWFTDFTASSAHSSVECSNRGTCFSLTGECICIPGLNPYPTQP
jgi:hypothetical protein